MDMSLFSSDCDRHCSDPDEDVEQSVDLISSDFKRKTELQCNDDSEVHVDDEAHEEHEDEDDFSFVYIGDKDSPISADEVFEDGQIRQVFPLFDQRLLLGGEYEVEEIDRLPIHPTVDKVFIESPRGHPSSMASEHEDSDDAAAGPFCEWSKESTTGTAELSKKSNSTGFSKLWRIKEKVSRSNSDGRDAFVFLKHSHGATTTTTATTSSSSSSSSSSTSSSAKLVTAAGSYIKVNAAGGKPKQGTKAKKSTVYENYLRSRGEHTEEERRRSYLPYRPELMGFFTNVHGGLSKNVHPY